jgi:hypothetical protein
MADTNIGPQMMEVLRRYNLQAIAEWVSQRITAGASPDQIWLEIYDQPLFKQMYPEIGAREELMRGTGITMAPLDPEKIISLRNSYRAVMRSWGLPESFYSHQRDFFNLIVQDVSPDELNQRLETANDRVRAAPPEVRQAFNEIAGIAGDDALFALFVDVNKAMPELEKLVRVAEAGGAARRFGFSLARSEMERLGGYGVGYGQLTEGFASLDERRGLFDETLFEEEDYTVGEEGIEAVFGLEGGATEKLKQRAGTRTAQTAGSSGGISEERGATSLGGAGRR